MMGDGKEKWQDELCAYGRTCLDGSVTGGPLGNEVAVVTSFPRHTSSLQTVYDGLYVAAYRGGGCLCEVWPQGEVQFPAAYLEQTLYPFHGSLLAPIDTLSLQFQARAACGRRFAAWPNEPTQHLSRVVGK